MMGGPLGEIVSDNLEPCQRKSRECHLLRSSRDICTVIGAVRRVLLSKEYQGSNMAGEPEASLPSSREVRLYRTRCGGLAGHTVAISHRNRRSAPPNRIRAVTIRRMNPRSFVIIRETRTARLLDQCQAC